MTRRLLLALADMHAPFLVTCGLALVLLVALPLLLLIDGVGAYFRWQLEGEVLAARIITCPRGHTVLTRGVWSCGCGSVHEGHAFGRCPACGTYAGGVRCACALVCRNPLAEEA